MKAALFILLTVSTDIITLCFFFLVAAVLGTLWNVLKDSEKHHRISLQRSHEARRISRMVNDGYDLLSRISKAKTGEQMDELAIEMQAYANWYRDIDGYDLMRRKLQRRYNETAVNMMLDQVCSDRYPEVE